jgi:outer membrane PBP1 activator LpoA protein
MHNPVIKWRLPVWLLFILYGCSPPVVHIDTPSVSDRFLEAAQERDAVGDYQGAVDYYLRAAAVTTGGQRLDILLQAAGSLVQSDEYNRAIALLDRLTLAQLSNIQRQRYTLIRASIAPTRNHADNKGFTEKLASGMRIAGQPPQQIALLLPLTGTLADAAAAIREGILAAYNDMPGDSRRPAIKTYDVGDDPENIMEIYHQAVSEGAQFVIGPLRKDTVQTLALQQLTVPVLALNWTVADTVANPMLFQFGLAPEDEAREVARRAWHDGHTRAIALVPEGAWGDRVYGAFREEWLQLGGRLLDMERYNADEPDHGQQIRAALNLDSSRQRHQQLVRLLGRNLEFEPRRRKDVDFIFVLATPWQGRLIRPQLKFYRASKIPVYTTSHVYTGHPDDSLDSDMNGLVFCDIPWVLDPNPDWKHLQQRIKNFRPDNAINYSRFFALGIDAWRVVPYIGQAENDSRGAYEGASGNLTLDAVQRIHRSLRWAHFQNGLPVLLETTVDTPENQGVVSAVDGEPRKHRLQ